TAPTTAAAPPTVAAADSAPRWIKSRTIEAWRALGCHPSLHSPPLRAPSSHPHHTGVPPRQRRAYRPPARASVAGDRPPDPNERPGPPPGRPPPPVALSIRGRSPRVRLRTTDPAGPKPRRP